MILGYVLQRKGKDGMRYHALTFCGISLLFFVLVACGSADAQTNTPTGASTKTQVITVVVGDFYIRSQQTSFLTGVRYRFIVTNGGQHEHDFLIMHPMTTETMVMDGVYKHALAYISTIPPGKAKTLDFTFDHTAPAGMLEFSCHYGGHWEAGMHQAIVVHAPKGTAVSAYPNNAMPTDVATSAPNSTSAETVSFDANFQNLQNQYFFVPKSVTIKKGQSITLSNLSDIDLSFVSHPDASLGTIKLSKNQHQDLLFKDSGTYTISCEQFQNQQFTVIVQ